MMHFLSVFGILGLCAKAVAQDGDHGIILTVLPLSSQVLPVKLMAIPTTPYEDFNGTLPGISFQENVFFTSCDVDYKRKRIFISDSHTKTLLVGVNFNTSFNDPLLKFNFIHYGASPGTRIAYDGLSDNLYWTDPIYKRIGVQPAANDNTLNHMYRFIVDTDLSRPEGIAVDSVHRYLFWTDTGFRKIERSNLAGQPESRHVLVNNSILYPAAVVADSAEKRIYWVDRIRETIETVTYNGTDRRLVRRITNTLFYDIALFKEILMVTDILGTGQIRFVDKNTGQFRYHHLTIPLKRSYGIAMYHEELEPEGQDNCANSSCSDLCVNENSAAAGFQCLCRFGYHPSNNDTEACMEDEIKLQQIVVLANETSVCTVDLRVLAHSSYTLDCIYSHSNGTFGNILFLEFDSLRSFLMFATAAEVFILRLDQESPEAERIFDASGTISGMSYDWIDFMLYVSDIAASVIYAVSMETLEISEVPLSLESPAKVLIVPLERKLFWISRTTNYTIESASVTGEDRVTLVESNTLTDPKDLAHDAVDKRILWSDEWKIRSCNYDGTDLKVAKSTPYQAYLLHVYKDYLIWMSLLSGYSVMRSEHMVENFAISTAYFADMSYITSLVVIDEQEQPRQAGPCSSLHSPCEQICLSVGAEAVCHCEYGYTIEDEGQTCVSEPVQTNFILLSDWTHNRIYQVDQDTETVHAVNTDQTVAPRCVLYDYNNSVVIWSSLTGSTLIEANLDGTEERILGNIEGAYIERFTVDFTSGNIYYTAVSDFAVLGYSFSYVGVMSPEGLHAILIEKLHQPMGIAIYAADGLLFYTERSLNNAFIGKAYMDGSNNSVLINGSIGDPKGLAIDYKARRIYWVDGYYDKIESANFDGGDRLKIFEDFGADLVDIGLDDNYFYFIGWNRPHISKISKTNSTDATIVASNAEFGRLESMYIFSEDQSSPPINQHCAHNNGKAICSTFCLPSNNGYVCACQEDMNLLEDNRTCADVFRCNETIPNGALSTSCLLYIDTACMYTCSYGFRPHATSSELNCEEDGWDVTEPCEEIFCENEDHTVVFPDTCDWKVGSECIYDCTEGYFKAVNASVSLLCGSDGSWSEPTDEACQEIFCENEDHTVVFPETCDRKVGSECSYECTEGYLKAVNASVSLLCGSDGSWSELTNEACQEIFCKNKSNDFIIGESCDLKIGSECNYDCVSGYIKAADAPVSLVCSVSGTWLVPADGICQVTNTAAEGQSSSEVVAPAVGGTIGAVVLICIILLLVCIVCRRRRREGPRRERLDSRRSESESVVSSHHSRSSFSPAPQQNRQEAFKPGSNVGLNNPVYDRQDIDNQSQSTHYMTLDSVSSHGGPPPYTTIGSVNTAFSALNPNYDKASVTPSQSSYLTPQPTTQ